MAAAAEAEGISEALVRPNKARAKPGAQGSKQQQKTAGVSKGAQLLHAVTQVQEIKARFL
jgi:hypothetical protein